MDIYVLMVHRGIGLVDVSLHPDQSDMWCHFGKRIICEADSDDFFPVFEAHPEIRDLARHEDWTGVCDLWSDYWDGEKHTDFDVLKIDWAEPVTGKACRRKVN